MKSKSIEKIKRDVALIAPSVEVSLERGCVVLRGQLDKWEDIFEAGTAAVSKKYLGVVNDIKLKGFEDKMIMPKTSDSAIDGETPDVLVIGGGIVGCAIARELRKYQMSVLLVEKSYDVATGASSRNDGCVHVGIDLHQGQQKLEYNGRGNEMYSKLCEELEIDFERKGHVVMFRKKWEKLFGYAMKIRAKQNKIKDVSVISGDELRAIESGTPDWCTSAVLMMTGGIVSPYKLTVALAENAVTNGAKISLDTVVTGMDVKDGKVAAVKTNRGTVYPKIVVNAAGVYADKIAEMAGDRTFTIHPRKGTNLILDKKTAAYSERSIAKSPITKLDEKNSESLASATGSKSHTKGGGIVRTIDGNVLVGPNAIEIPEREDYTTSLEDIESILEKQSLTATKMTKADVITYFSGTRAATYEEDFVVRKGIFTKNVLEAAGIQSPGITAAPAIAVDIAAWASEYLGGAPKNPAFNPKRKAVPHLANMSDAARDALIKKNPDYGFIVCRCEEVSKGEIIDALNSPVPSGTVDGIKRRVRPGMGRCQGGFCSPLVVGIIAEHYGIPEEQVRKAEDDAFILYGNTK